MNSHSIHTIRLLFMACQDLLGSSIQHHSLEHDMVYQFHDQCRIVANLVSVVKDLHRLSSQELKKLIREPENNTIQWTTKDGSTKQAIDLVSFVKDLHSLSSQELRKLIRETENNTIQWTTEDGSSKQMEYYLDTCDLVSAHYKLQQLPPVEQVLTPSSGDNYHPSKLRTSLEKPIL